MLNLKALLKQVYLHVSLLNNSRYFPRLLPFENLIKSAFHQFVFVGILRFAALLRCLARMSEMRPFQRLKLLGEGLGGDDAVKEGVVLDKIVGVQSCSHIKFIGLIGW